MSALPRPVNPFAKPTIHAQCLQLSSVFDSLGLPKPWNVTNVETDPAPGITIDTDLESVISGVISGIISAFDDDDSNTGLLCCSSVVIDPELLEETNASGPVPGILPNATAETRNPVRPSPSPANGTPLPSPSAFSGNATSNDTAPAIQAPGSNPDDPLRPRPLPIDPSSFNKAAAVGNLSLAVPSPSVGNMTVPLDAGNSTELVGGYAEEMEMEAVATERFGGDGGGKFGSGRGAKDLVTRVLCEDGRKGRSIVGIEIRVNPIGNLTCNATVFPDLRRLPDLRTLTVTGCNMNGAAIPWRTFGRVLNQLENINLVSNNLTGRITADIGDLKNLTAVRLDGNRIDGTIPAAVGRIDHLQILRVAGNTNMTGFLPPSMASMAHLQWLDINGTSITGDISTAPLPKNITTCNLSPLFCVPTAFEAPVGAKYMTPCGLLTACNSTDADEVGLLPTAVSMNRTSPSPFVSPSPLAVINGTAGVNGTTPGWNLTELIGNAGNRTDLTSPSPLVSPSQSPLVLPSPSPSPSPSPLRPPSPMNPPPAVILTAALPTPENKILAPSPSPEASPSSSSSSSSPVPAVVGTIAVIAVAVVAILVVLMYKRRGQRGDSSNGEDGPSPGRDYDIQLKSIKEVKEFGSDGDRDDMERVRREVLGATRTRDGNLAVAAEGEEIGSVRRRLGSDVRSEVSEEEKEEFGVRVSPFVDPDARRTNPFTDGAEMGIVGRRRMLEPLSVVVHPRDPVNRGFEERETR